MLKQEMKRAIINRNMLVGLIIGLLLTISYEIQYVFPQITGELSGWYSISSAFNYWLGASCSPMQSYIFFNILPILAVLPAGLSLHEDYTNGYYRQILIRGVKKKYYTAKIISIFCSGGLVIVLPLIISLILTSLKLPFILPEGIDSAINRNSMLFELYYTHPMLHLLLYLFIDFCAGGGMAVLSLLITYFVDYRFIILIFPFSLYYFTECLDRMFGSNDYSPNYFLISGFPERYLWEFVVLFIFIILVAGLSYIKGMRYGKDC